MKRFLQILFLLVISSPRLAKAQDAIDITAYRLGKTEVSLYEECYNPCEKSKVLFINLHDNERTSVNAALDYMKTKGGTMIYIFNFEKRNIAFTLDGRNYSFDPNRMFSRVGRIATLKTNSASYSPDAEKALASFANPILQKFIVNNNLVVAFHNNTDSNYSILTYKHLIDKSDSAGRYFINPEMDPDDFILTNNREIFDTISSRNINTVWEIAINVVDDGSLSIYAGKNNIRYINVEAEHGHQAEQQRMLEAIDDVIKKYKIKAPENKN